MENLKNEIWKPINGYEGLYIVSNLGRIKSIGYQNKIITPRKNRAGYLYVNLWKNGRYKSKFIHRLVPIAFIINPEDKAIVNHINGNKTDNRVENLEWNTQSENIQHAIKKLNINYGRCYRRPLLSRDVVCEIRKLIAEGFPATVIASKFNISRITVGNIKNRKTYINIK